MSKQFVKKGQTSYLAVIFIQDSSSTTGAGLTGLTNGSAGLVCYRARADDGNAGGTQITLSGGTRGTWSSGGFVEKDSTNMPGVYELGVPDAALATGSNYAVILLKGATNMAPLVMEFQLVNFDPLDAVHLGLSSLPNTAVTTNASLLTSGTGTDQLSVTSGRIDVGKALGTAITLDANNVLNVSAKYLGGTLLTARDIGASVLLSAGTGTGQLDFTTGVVKANATQWLGGTIPAVNVTGVPLVDLKYTLGTISPAAAGSVRADITTGQIATGVWTDTTAGDFTVASSVGKSVMNGVALGTGLTINAYTGNTPQTGDAFARVGAPAGASTSADIAALKADLDGGVALTAGERSSVATALLDLAAGVETGMTLRQATRIILSALAGKASGLATTTATFRDTNDAKNRITATVDASGNRTAVTLDAS